ncbi:MAG: DUF2220 domain-containing protein [Pseudomonadota bacterium]|nr:DUF2220 domain-containing protein [Pseudomonadota bacterium]
MNGIEKPVWLSEETHILAMLHVVLDRFDRQPGDIRQRHVTLAAEEQLPALASNDSQADETWAQVLELERLGVLAVRAGRRAHYDADWKAARLAFAPLCEPVLRDWLQREWLEPAMLSWRRAVAAHAGAFPGGCEPLLKRRIVIPNRSAEEVLGALATLGKRGATAAGPQGPGAQSTPATLRHLSATAFWGDSKVLDDRGDLIAALFPDLAVRERTLVVAVHLPVICGGVLFIENQDTYTAAVAGFPEQARDLALIYAAGFRGTAARIRSRSGALLHYCGEGSATSCRAFERWWYEEGAAHAPGPLWFWGDLDFAGMQILKALRSRFADACAWRTGYEPMLETLRARGGYSPAATDSQGQVDPGATGCPFADGELLPAVRNHGQIDQESGCFRAAGGSS